MNCNNCIHCDNCNYCVDCSNLIEENDKKNVKR